MISVLIPLYNGVEFISESVTSVLNQTYENWELLIGVNGHPANSDVFKKAKEYESDKVRVFDFHWLKSAPLTYSELKKYCNGDYIATLDVDDKWVPEKLEKQVPFMEKYDVIGTHTQYFGDISTSPNIPMGDITNYDFFMMNPFINSSIIIKKELCNFPDSFVYDYDLWLTLFKQRKRFYNVDEKLTLHRVHKSSFFNSGGQNNNKVPDLLKSHKNFYYSTRWIR